MTTAPRAEESAGQLKKKLRDFPQQRDHLVARRSEECVDETRPARRQQPHHHTPSQRQPLKQPHRTTMSSELDGLCCPLTLEVFEDPCTLVGDGHTYERASIQAWLDSGKLTSPTTGATLGLGGTRLVPNYAVKRTIAELAARGRLPPKGTSPRLATEVSQVTAAAEVLTVAEEPLPPPPPSDPRITANFSKRPTASPTATAGREAAARASLRALNPEAEGGFSEGRQGFSDRNQTVRGGAKFGMGKVVDSSKDKMYVGQFQEQGHVVSDKGQSFSDKRSFSGGPGSAGARRRKERRGRAAGRSRPWSRSKKKVQMKTSPSSTRATRC